MSGKKILCILFALCCMLLGACGGEEAEVFVPNVDPSVNGTNDEKDQETVDRLTYYEGLIGSLQEELLAVKAELFATKSEFDERFKMLESVTTGNTSNQEFTYSVTGDSVTLTAYHGDAINVEIPSSVDGKKVKALGDKLFLNNTTVQSIVIPDGVESIGWFAFSGCVSLGMVAIPTSVSTIHYGAFENCPTAMKVFCSAGSYAESYAKSYGIATSNE